MKLRLEVIFGAILAVLFLAVLIGLPWLLRLSDIGAGVK